MLNQEQMPLNPTNPNIPIRRNEHRHDEVTTPEFALALGEAASKLGEGFQVFPLAEDLAERTVHYHEAILEPKGRTIRGILESGEAHLAIISKGDTGPLYQEAARIMANRRPTA